MACRQSTLRLDLSVRQAIGALLEAGASPAELARLYHCHPATVYRANLDLDGDVAPPPPSVQGRPRKMLNKHYFDEIERCSLYLEAEIEHV
jgi:Helix-turn-helix domain